jgi:hypothetical protein
MNYRRKKMEAAIAEIGGEPPQGLVVEREAPYERLRENAGRLELESLEDVQMPEMGGFECTAIIRAREKVTRFHLPNPVLLRHPKHLKGHPWQLSSQGYTARVV